MMQFSALELNKKEPVAATTKKTKVKTKKLEKSFKRQLRSRSVLVHTKTGQSKSPLTFYAVMLFFFISVAIRCRL